MPEDPKPSRPLSEIGHLFLSSIRQQQMHGAPLPVRRPPGATPPPPPTPAKPASSQRDMAIELTPEEFAQVYAAAQSDDLPAAPQESLPIPSVTAVIASHLNGKQMERVKEYARHLAGEGQRIGLIVADAAEFKLLCFDGHAQAAGEPQGPSPTRSSSATEIQAAINELSFDLDRWLLLVPNSHSAEGRELLGATDHWVLLCTCDHDGVVACYRTLKGLNDLHGPPLSLAVLDALSRPDAQRIHHKLAAVCQQFLGMALQEESPVRKFPSAPATEFEVMCWKPSPDKASAAAAPPWRVVAEFLARARAPEQRPAAPQASQESPPPAAPVPPPRAVPADEEVGQVIELAGGRSDAAAIIAAVLHSGQGQFIECPLSPPPCPQARLAVGRDRSLVLLALAKAGLAELRSIALAYRWLIDNRPLIAMALPQLAIDIQQSPRLRLLVDQADFSADLLHPLLQSPAVQVQTYRRLRWGDKQGLLLQTRLEIGSEPSL